MTIAHAAAVQEARPPSSIVRALPGSFDRLILRMLEKDPAARFPSKVAMPAMETLGPLGSVGGAAKSL